MTCEGVLFFYIGGNHFIKNTDFQRVNPGGALAFSWGKSNNSRPFHVGKSPTSNIREFVKIFPGFLTGSGDCDPYLCFTAIT